MTMKATGLKTAFQGDLKAAGSRWMQGVAPSYTRKEAPSRNQSSEGLGQSLSKAPKRYCFKAPLLPALRPSRDQS